MGLAKELEYYDMHLSEWVEHNGKFVLIKGEKHYGFYSSYDDALGIGYDKFKLEDFLVKRVNVIQQAHTVTRMFV